MTASISRNATIRPDSTRPAHIIFLESECMVFSSLVGRQAADFQYGANLNRPPSSGRDFACDLDGFIQVVGFNQEETAQLLAGFGKRTVGDYLSSVANAYAGGH